MTVPLRPAAHVVSPEGLAEACWLGHTPVVDAAALVGLLYRGKTRPTGEPAVSRFHAVRGLLAGAGVRERPALDAALLQDVLEDAALSEAYLRLRFGRRTAALVRLLSGRKSWHTGFARARSVLDEMASAGSPEAILIDLADRLHDVRKLHKLRPVERREILHETEELFLPFFERALADRRLGPRRAAGRQLLARLRGEVARQRAALVPSRT